jgi:hypothetical protein
MGRSARRGGSCPTSRVWVGSAMRSSYESSKWRSYFAPPPGMGMKAVGRNPSVSGARDDSPPFQRWVEEEEEIESPGDGTGFCFSAGPALAKRRLERGTPDLGFACISAWPGHPATDDVYYGGRKRENGRHGLAAFKSQRSFAILATHLSVLPRSSCSQNRRTHVPVLRSFLLFARSRLWLRLIFRAQNDLLVRGTCPQR